MTKELCDDFMNYFDHCSELMVQGRIREIGPELSIRVASIPLARAFNTLTEEEFLEVDKRSREVGDRYLKIATSITSPGFRLP